MIEQAFREAPRLFDIKGGFRLFDSIQIDIKKETLKLEDQLFHPAKIVSTQLRKASAAALFVCTAGEAISKHSAKTAAEDPVMAYIFDRITSYNVCYTKLLRRVQIECVIPSQ